MTGPKLNERAMVAGERSGTKATAKYVRTSASKARVVLDLIRGLDVRRASEVLRFSERGISHDIAKVLQSAVANAVHNEAQDPDELFVIACYADEGPTMRRFRPRARGRATRIRKRSCHITVIVARMSDDRIEVLNARDTARGGAAGRGGSAQSRRDRVERSRQRAAGLRDGQPAETTVADEAVTEDLEAKADDLEAKVEELEALADTLEADQDTPAEGSASDEADAARGGSEADDEPATSTDESAIPHGAVEAPEDGSVPEGYEIKGNATSLKYHPPGSRYYDITQAELYFDTPENAEAAGYEAPAGTPSVEETESETEIDTEDETETDEEDK
ncbi:MAG: 50S ribosomal protein L22 [Actinomycetota bacterium]|nr:50S ribosomal protein L22 [Actinomycetota bacterium]